MAFAKVTPDSLIFVRTSENGARTAVSVVIFASVPTQSNVLVNRLNLKPENVLATTESTFCATVGTIA